MDEAKTLRILHLEDDAFDAEIRTRLNYELSVIETMGFSAYFLIVWDLTQFARHADIWWNVRGSGAGSVAGAAAAGADAAPSANLPTYSILAAARMALMSSSTSLRLRSLSRNCSIAGLACSSLTGCVREPASTRICTPCGVALNTA